jgi:hypothetical protein
VLARTGDGRALAARDRLVPAGATEAEAALDLPIEIRNQVVRLDLDGPRPARRHGAARRTLPPPPRRAVAAQETTADAPLIGDLFYLDRALSPYRGTPPRHAGGAARAPDRGAGPGRPRDPEGASARRWPAGSNRAARCSASPAARMAERPDPLLPVPLRAGERRSAARCPGSGRRRWPPSPRARPSPG